jgi:hypothetical protein
MQIPMKMSWIAALLLIVATGHPLAVREEMRHDANSYSVRDGNLYAAGSYLTTPLDRRGVTIDPSSAHYVANLNRMLKQYNYGARGPFCDVAILENAVSMWITGPSQPTQVVLNSQNFAPLQAKWKAVPIPDGFAPDAGSDREAVIYQPSTDRLWEFWGMERNVAEGLWEARWGGRMDNVSTQLGYWVTEMSQGRQIKYGAYGSGIPMLGTTLTVEELRAGEINHIIGVTLPEVLYNNWSHPAQRGDGRTSTQWSIPEGAIFRLPASLDIDALGLSKFTRMIAKAVLKYGMIVVDLGGNCSFRAQNPGGHNNKFNQYPEGDPYIGLGGILNCPAGTNWYDKKFYGVCAPAGGQHLSKFPWTSLQLVKLHFDH